MINLKKTGLLAAAFAVCLCMARYECLTVSAAGISRNIHTAIPSVGVGEILDSTQEAEEYKAAAESVKEERKQMYGFENLGIANVDTYLNVRKTPGEDGTLVGKMPKYAGCDVLEVEGDWIKIKSGKVTGYVKGEYLLTGANARALADEKAADMAVCNSGGLRVREEPNTDCPIITLVAEGEELEVVEVLDGWVKIMLDNEEAYVSADYVDIAKKLEKAVSVTELKYGQGVSDVRVDLVNYAKQFLGNPYVWGGTSLTKGVDCSGFTMQIYKKYGISLPHYSVAQSRMGKSVKLSEAKPGDLVFYAKNGTVNHVGIYIGNGQVIHASNPRTGIKISNVSYRSLHSVRRILD